MTQDLSHHLPSSLGTLFGQPPQQAEAAPVKAMPPTSIPGAYNAPELCTLVERYRIDLLPSDPIAEVKIDGLRSLYIAGSLYTREGSPMECAAHCLPILRALEAYFGQPMFFDGEYVENRGLEATIAAFRSRRGAGCLWLFDAVPFSEWRSGKPSRQGLRARKNGLRKALEAVTGNRSNVSVGYLADIPTGPRMVEGHANRVWSDGWEGLVIKSEASRYLRKRTCDWMKVKLDTVSDMMLVDVNGKTVGGVETAKSLQVRLVGNPPTKPVLLPVSGAAAAAIWQRRSQLVGTVIKVRHAGFTGGGNPREARLFDGSLPLAI